MVIRKMKLQINNLDTVLEYQGADDSDVANQIQRDENALLEYMMTGNMRGQKAFCFQGFMFKKELIVTAQFTEPDF